MLGNGAFAGRDNGCHDNVDARFNTRGTTASLVCILHVHHQVELSGAGRVHLNQINFNPHKLQSDKSTVQPMNQKVNQHIKMHPK